MRTILRMTSPAVPSPESSPSNRSSLTIRNGRVGGRIVDLRCLDGRITAIEAAGTLEPNGGASIDARDGWILPGFVDAHVHLVLAGTVSDQIDLTGCPDRATFEARIEQGLQSLEDDAWLIAHGWLETDWGGEIPDASWLAAAGNRPAVCIKHDHHACLVNPAALAIALDRFGDRTCPPGGEIVRDAQGQPTGLMLESAAWMIVNPVVPTPSVQTRRGTTIAASQYLATLGITQVGSMTYAQEVVDVLDAIRDQLAVGVAVTMLDRELPIDAPLARLEALDRDDRVRLIGCKAFLDGTLGSRTAAMLADYADRPGERGLLVELAQRGELMTWIEFVVTRGWSPSMHAIGDAAARLALDACDHAERFAREAGLKPPKIRIEHCQTVDPADIPRFKTSDRHASMQPTHLLDDGTTVEHSLGAERFDAFFPFRAIHDAGGTLSFGSDWPIENPDPIEGIRVAVTGQDRHGRVVPGTRTVDVATAIRAYTTNARAALGLPPVALEIGDPADLVVLDRDPAALDWTTETPTVRLTAFRGRVTHLPGPEENTIE